MILRACVVWRLALALLEVHLIVSPSTPAEVVAGIQVLPEKEDVLLTTRVVAIQLSSAEEVRNQPVILLDYTYDPFFSLRLIQSGPESLVICMYPGCPQEIQSSMTADEYSRELIKVFDSFGFTNAFLVGDIDSINNEIVMQLRSTPSTAFKDVVVLTSPLSESEVLNFVGRMIKPAGTNLGVFILGSDTAVSLIRALKKYYLLEKGFAYILSQSAALGLFAKVPSLIDGLLYVADRRTATATSRIDYESQLLDAELEAISEAISSGADSPQAVRKHLTSSYGGKARNCSSVLVNIQQSVPVLVESLNEYLRFPGNSTDLPKETQAVIHVSSNYDGLSYDGSVYPDISSILRGFMIGYEEVNNRQDVLPNFKIANNSVSFGVMLNPDWARQRVIAQKNLLGVAFHPVPLSQNVIGMSEIMKELEIEIPMTTGAGSSKLSDPKAYPLFVRTTSSVLYVATAMARFFKLFGWKRAAFVYSPVEEDQDFYKCFVNVSAQYGIEITNNETNRLIPPNLGDVQEQINTTLSEILSSSVRIVILSHVFSYYIVERMYDLGARSGDYLFLISYGLSNTYYMGDEESARKRRIVTKGAMMFFAELFVGSVGHSVQQRMLVADGDKMYPMGCTYYDCAMLVSYALDFMVAKGLEYENATHLVKTMRETRYQGCIGHIQIESGTNDKVPGDFSIINMQVDDKFENVTLKSVARYSPSRTQLFFISNELQWPDGSTHFPDSWEQDGNCPYFLREIRDFEKGRILSMVVCFVYSLMTAIVTAYIWKKWWNIRYPDLTEPKSITMEDVFALASIPIDFLQIAAVGPSIGLADTIMNLLNSVSMTLESVINMTNGVFWGIEIAAFVMVTIYVTICVLKIFDLDSRIARWSFCSTVVYLADLFLPVLGNALFLPVISTFISTFNCFRSVGPDFTDSFLNRDCSQKCWTETHIPYAVLAAVYLTLYTPTAVLTRPLWQDLQTNLHLKALPLCLMMKSGMEMWLIAASATMKTKEEVSHAVVYLITISIYLVFVLKVKAYNYER